MAFIPDAQTLLIVVASVECGNPAPKVACRAGAWPIFAETTFPMYTSSTCSTGSFEPSFERAPRMAAEPSWGAERDFSVPLKLPTGVRDAETMTTSLRREWGVVLNEARGVR